MELNFDKEMDALLRQTARQEKSAPPVAGMHLDADELAAFAAGGLPLKARARAAGHLADCGSCRTTVANLVFFEDREAEKTAAVAAPAPIEKSVALLDRLKAFFTIPVLAYSMGGLILVFAGMFVVSVYRNGSDGREMAQANTSRIERPSAVRDAAPESGEISPQETPALMDANSSANAAPMASAANTATGGAFTMPAPAFGAKESTSNTSGYTCRDCGSPGDDEKPAPAKLADKKDVVLDGLKAEPVPPVDAPEGPLSKPQGIEQTTVVPNMRQQENNVRSNSNVMMPDGGSDKDRKRAVTTEAGANVTSDQASVQTLPAKIATKKPAKKSSKKKAAATAAEAPASPTPTPAKEKPEEEHPPCR